jgi:hypothetical protein
MHSLAPDRAPLAAALSLFLGCAITPVAAQAAETVTAAKPAAQEAPEASIPFADHGGISNWEADGNRGLWVQSSHRAWYYGVFAAPCTGLQFHETLRFRFSPSGTLDRYSQVETRDPGGSCWFKSFKASDGPPARDPAHDPGHDKARKKDPGQQGDKGATAAATARSP